jgi:nitrogen PTS system EIIA component
MPATSTPVAPVRLARVFPSEATVIGPKLRDKAGVVAELAHRLVELGRIPPREETWLVDSVLEREKMGSTALGNGIAIPHCRSGLIENLVGAVAIDHRGLAFDAVDGEPVYTVFLLLAPIDDKAQHFDVLGQISAIGRDKALRLCLRGCQSAQALSHFLQEWDHSMNPGLTEDRHG